MKEWKNELNSFNSMKGLLYAPWYKATKDWKYFPTHIPPAPVEASLDPIHACNLNCDHCNAHRYLVDDTKYFRMTDEHLLNLTKYLGDWGVKAVCYGGGGEPTMHSKLEDALYVCKDNGMEASIATNGTLFTPNLMVAMALTCRWVGVSIDAATAGTYQIGRKANFFDKAIENLRRLVITVNSLKATQQINCDVTYKFLVFNYNQHEIYDACKLAKSLGVKDFHARPADYSHQGMGDLASKIGGYDVDKVKEQFKKCHELEDDNFHVYTVVHKFDSSLRPRKDFSQCYASPCCIQLCADGGIYLCTLPETEIMLKDSTTKQIQDIKVGEEVLTHKGIQKVTHVMNRIIDEEVYELKRTGYYKSLTVTKEHPIYALNRKYKSHRPNHMLEYLDEIDFLPAKDLKKGCFVTYKINKKEVDMLELTEDLCWLLGMYGAEGHITGNRGRDNSILKQQVIFSLHISEIAVANKISDIIKTKFNYTPKIKFYPLKNSLRVECYNVLIANWFNMYCSGNKTLKSFTDDLLLLPIKKQKEIIRGWELGDGTLKWRKNSFQGCSISEQLSNQLYEMYLRNDIPVLLLKRYRWNRVNPVYEIYYQLDRKHNTLFIKNDILYSICEVINKKHYKGQVYNIEVENDHSYMSNKICSHNCPDQRFQEEYKIGTHYPKLEGIAEAWGSQKHYKLVFEEGKSHCTTRCTFSPYCKQCEELFIKDHDPMCWKFI